MIIDVAALDVIDSFACHTLRAIAQVARLRGAETVIVGIQPDVAFTMVQLGASLEPVRTALDLEEGFAPTRRRQHAPTVLARTGSPVTDQLRRLRQNYQAGLLRYLSRRDEPALCSAYELGREGLPDGVSLLDVVQIHHHVLVEVLRDTQVSDLPGVADAATAFLVEVLASFEMTRLGFMESRARHGHSADPLSGRPT